MFIFEVLNLIYETTRLALGVTMVMLNPVDFPDQLGGVSYVQAERGNYRELNEKCTYDGVIVPFARTWEEEDKATGFMRKPDPDTIAGYAVLFYQKTCEGKVEPVLRMGQTPGLIRAAFNKGERTDVDEYDFSKPEKLPKWLDQVKVALSLNQATSPRAAQALYSINSEGKKLLKAEDPQSYAEADYAEVGFKVSKGALLEFNTLDSVVIDEVVTSYNIN